MPKFKSNIANPGEMQLACAVLVDTSSSMDPVLSELRKGLVALGDSLSDEARGKVEIEIITFDDDARVLVPFGPAYEYEVPEITCTGMTAMHAAVDLALKELRARKDEYHALGTPYYRPWVFLLTDGGANDPDNGAFTRLLEEQRNKGCTFFPVAIGDADKRTLGEMQKDGIVLTASKENFANAFVWLSNSLSITSVSDSTALKVDLPRPGDYQLSVEPV